MKIAFLINDMNVCGGTHKQFLKLLEYSDAQGVDFKVITKVLDYEKTYPGFRKFQDRTFVFDAFYYPSWMGHRVVRRLIPYYQKQGYQLRELVKDCDIINIHDGGYENYLSLFKGKKVYWQVNDLPYCFRVGVHAKIEKDEQSIKQCTKIVRDSKYVTEFSVNVGKNAEKIKECFHRNAHVFYCGVEPICINRNNKDTFNRFDERKINLLTSGVMLQYRNYETQIMVVRTLLEKGYDVRLNIIGKILDKSYGEKIQTLIEENGLKQRITIEGQVDDEKFKQLHQNADLFIFINIDQSWGLAVFEAMSCGLPVLVSNSVGAVEILNNNIDSIHVNPTDVNAIVKKIEELCNDRDYYERISETASQFHKDWTWDKAYSSRMLGLMLRDNQSC